VIFYVAVMSTESLIYVVKHLEMGIEPRIIDEGGGSQRKGRRRPGPGISI
jgi:hypothetical protein